MIQNIEELKKTKDEWGNGIDWFVPQIEADVFDGDDVAGGVAQVTCEIVSDILGARVEEDSELDTAISDACHASYLLAFHQISKTIGIDHDHLEYLVSVNCETGWKLKFNGIPTDTDTIDNAYAAWVEIRDKIKTSSSIPVRSEE